MKAEANSKTVLVGVLKNKRDQRILLKEHWYRIPIAHLPKRKFEYITFYQPSGFGKTGKRIEYYAPISKKTVTKRIDLLPNESIHPRANDDYLRIEFKKYYQASQADKKYYSSADIFWLYQSKDLAFVKRYPATLWRRTSGKNYSKSAGTLRHKNHRRTYDFRKESKIPLRFCRVLPAGPDCD